MCFGKLRRFNADRAARLSAGSGPAPSDRMAAPTVILISIFGSVFAQVFGEIFGEDLGDMAVHGVGQMIDPPL